MRHVDAENGLSSPIGHTQQVLAVISNVHEPAGIAGLRDGAGPQREGQEQLARGLIETPHMVQIRHIQSLSDDREPPGRVQGDAVAAPFDELEPDDLPGLVQLGDEAIVVSGVLVAVDTGDKVFLGGRIDDETVRPAEFQDLQGEGLDCAETEQRCQRDGLQHRPAEDGLLTGRRKQIGSLKHQNQAAVVHDGV